MFRRSLWKYYGVAIGIYFLVGYFFYGHVWVGMLFFPSLYWVRKIALADIKRKNRQRYLCHYGEFLQIVETGITAGYSLEHAIVSAGKELKRGYGTKEEIVRDLMDIEKKLLLHESVDTCLAKWAEERSFEEMKLFSRIVASGRRHGGDVNRIIRQTAEAIAGRVDAEAEINTMMAGKILEYRVMCIMPLGIIMYVKMGSPDYFTLLYDNLPGIIFMTACFAVYILAVLLGRRFMGMKE